jgi:hypothetical protein
MRLELTIDDLVLDGFDPRYRHRIADAVERELTGLRLPGRTDRAGKRMERRAAQGRDGSPDAIAQAVRRAISATLSERAIR